MIRPVDIKLNAAHPELPLVEATTFAGAPSSVFIRGVPKAIGNWSITAVNVAVTYPDNSTTTRAAVESAEGVWVATIPGTATSGRTVAGFRILADGIDENGAAVTGYVLGFADFAVLSFFPVPAPGETFFYLRYFDTMPTAAKKMDVTTIDGILKYYNGTAWLPFTDLSNYYTKAETDNAIERVAAYYITYNAAGAAFPTRADLINAQTYYSGGAVRVPTRNDYAVVLADETHDGAEWRYIYAVADGETVGQWEPQYPVEGVIAYDNTVTPTSGNGVKSSGIWSAIWGALAALPTGFSSLYDWVVAQLAGKASTADATLTVIADSWEYTEVGVSIGIVQASETSYGWAPMSGSAVIGRVKGDIFSTELTWEANEWDGGFTFTAFRTGVQKGFVLGSQTSMAVASEAEAEELRNSKQNALTAQQLANIAAVPNKANTSDLRYTLPETATTISSASSEVISGETVYYGEATLADRTQNQVAVLVALDELRVTIPPAVSGKVRDFGLVVLVGLGEGTALAAPALVPVAPTGETITLMNAEGEMPTLADGTTTATGFTVLYFTEIGQGTFLVKGEQIQEVA